MKYNKTFIAKSDTDSKSRTVTSLISTQVVDRDGDVVIAQGMDARDFIKSPTVFYNHNYDLPIGTGVLSKGDDYIKAVTTFPKRPDDHEGEWFPSTILSLFVAKVIRGFSIGFDPIQGGVRRATKADVEKFGEGVTQVINKWKLFEYSVAPLPANQDALSLAVSKSIITKSRAGELFPGVEIIAPKRKTIIFMQQPIKQKPKLKPKAPDVGRIVALAIKKQRGGLYDD